MRGLFAARALKKCEAIGVYDGEARLPTMNTTAQPFSEPTNDKANAAGVAAAE